MATYQKEFNVKNGLAVNGTVVIDATGTVAANSVQSGAFEPANANIQSHISSTSNPHGVTATQVGLGNVTNESKATMFTSPTFTGTVSGITAAMVGAATISHTHNYAGSASAGGAANGANAVYNVGFGTNNFTWKQDAGTFVGHTGWASYLISNHGDGSNYYNQILIMPFFSAPRYTRMTGGTQSPVYDFITTENQSSLNTRFNSLGVGTDGSGTAGEIRATNNITAYYSDERLKDFHGTIPNALEKVLSLNGYYFTANEIAQSYGYDSKVMQVGISAQEIEKVLPEVVTDAPIGDGYKTVWYEKIIPLLIEAIKEQQSQIQELKEMISNGT